MISYIVAAAFFLMASTFLVSFASEPSGGGVSELEHIELKGTAASALGLLLGSPGTPSDWHESSTGIDALRLSGRLGLISDGASVRIDPAKFDALARGRFSTYSDRNGHVDYAEAKSALGLSGYDFHIRAYPVVPPDDAFFGTIGMDSYRVAYIGDYDAGLQSAAATTEAASLTTLNIGFTNAAADALVSPGDVFPDDSAKLREHLVPLIGSGVAQIEIAAGSGQKFDFHRVDASALEPHLASEMTLSTALALWDPGQQELGYTKGREVRATLGVADMTGLLTASLLFREWVDSDRGAGGHDRADYGNIELSSDGGATWCQPSNFLYTRSEDTATSGWSDTFMTRTLAINNAICPGVENNPRVLVAAHWKADNDNNIGYGWVLDDVRIEPTALTGFERTFEAPEYDLLIIGSDVDQSALASDIVKSAIRDYVESYDGRLVVLGGDTNTQWLQPLFHVGVQGSSPGVASPDTTHPLLTVPNELDWREYDRGTPPTAWSFTSGNDNLFNMVVGDNNANHILSVSAQGAFGGDSADGVVMLTSYLPYEFASASERSRFLANAVTYGRFHSLYLEVGPEVPTGIPTASVMRSGTMNVLTGAEVRYMEVAFQFYVWPGATAEQTAMSAAIYASQPTNLEIEMSDDALQPGKARATLTWEQPASWGTGTPYNYWVYRGHSGDFLGSRDEFPVAADDTAQPTHTCDDVTFACSWSEGGLTYGTTYFYNVTASTLINGVEARGTPAKAVNATHSRAPGAPTNLQATAAIGEVLLEWTPPTDNGGANITGYAIFVGSEQLVELGETTQALHISGDTTSRDYTVKALNGRGYGDASNVVTAAALAAPSLPTAPALTVAAISPANLTLMWTPPVSLGAGALTGYKIYNSTTGDPGAFYPLTQLNNPNAVSYVDSGLGTNQTRYYRVAAITDLGEGQNSTIQSNQTMAAPDTPMNPRATRVLTTTTVTWTAPPSEWPIDHYDVWRGNSQGDKATFLGGTSALTHLDLGGGTGKWYVIEAVNDAGRSNAATTPTLDAADAPTLQDVVASTPNNLTITWTAPVNSGSANITHFNVYRSTDGGTNWAFLAEASETNNVSFRDVGLGTNVTRHYKVTAVTDVAESDYSLVDSAKTMAAPDTPTSPAATRVLTTTAITWAAPTSDWPVSYYDVWRGDSQGALTEFVGSTPTLTVQDNAGTAGKWYAIKAVAPTGTSEAATVQSN